MLHIFDVTRGGDNKPTRWYFDNDEQAHAAMTAMTAAGATYSQSSDFITEAAELHAWLFDGEMAVNTPQQFVEKVANLLTYPDETGPDGEDAMEVLTWHINKAREILGRG